MITEGVTYGLVGGAMIGVAASIVLLFNGRVMGVSGIFGGLLNPHKGDVLWRISFILGILFGAFFMYKQNPNLFVNETGRSLPVIALAGLLVGFGTSMGTGCTSGHGVCGLARLSPRSLAATVAFMAVGFVVATLFHFLFVGGGV